MVTSLERLKSGYTNGGRGAAQRLMAGAGAIPITPNQLTVLGFAITACSGVLLYERQYVLAAIVFVVGSVLDALDGALARAHGKGTPFGGFLDSTLDRVSDGIILGAIALVLAEDGDMLALACVFVALVGSFLISYTRAKAEALGLRGDVGLMARLERIVLLAVAIPFGGYGSLRYAVYLLAGLTAFTVMQRVLFVHRQLTQKAEG
jgi:CDP-diacylglycerol---glycerol-3-phosphate 3-phosphatidyltransferase